MTAPTPPYGVAIHRAIVEGNLAHMKQVAQKAEEYLRQAGDLPSALALLKIEIAKTEKKG
jgi:Domain of unknown function (DUF1843)